MLLPQMEEQLLLMLLRNAEKSDQTSAEQR